MGHIFLWHVFCFSKIVFFLQGEWDFWKTGLQTNIFENKSGVNKWDAWTSKTMSPNVSHLLTQLRPTYWPYFWHPKLPQKQWPKLAETPICIVSSKKHTYKQHKPKQQKHHNFHTCTHNCPFDFDRKLFHFLAPPLFWFVLFPPSCLLNNIKTEKKKKKTNKQQYKKNTKHPTTKKQQL